MKYIFVTTQFEGYHSYPGAPEDVSFLRNEHRHIFKIKVWFSIVGDNRELEFFQVKRKIENCLDTSNLNNMSCEMISNNLYSQLSDFYPGREIRIEISEDGENGSYIEY